MDNRNTNHYIAQLGLNLLRDTKGYNYEQVHELLKQVDREVSIDALANIWSGFRPLSDELLCIAADGFQCLVKQELHQIYDSSKSKFVEIKPQINFFISYAKEDLVFAREISKQLRILTRNQTINEIFIADDITVGKNIKEEIIAQIELADIFLILLSSDYINSDSCYDIQMSYFLERHDKKIAKVVPVLLRKCIWESTPLAKLGFLCDGKNLVGNSMKDDFYFDMVREIEILSKQIRSQKKRLQQFPNDEQGWMKALSINTPDAYKNYLKENPTGRFLEDANIFLAKAFLKNINDIFENHSIESIEE